MTAQKQPLEVGVPLFPFSHRTLFRKDEAATVPTEEGSGAVPMPVSPAYEQQQSIPGRVPQAPHPVSPSGSVPGSWSSGSPVNNNYAM